MTLPAFHATPLHIARQLSIRHARITALSSPPLHTRRSALRLLALSTLPGVASAEQERAPPETTETPLYTQLACPPAHPTCRPVEIRDFRAGTGRLVQRGSTLYLKWTGRLADRYGWPIQKEDAEEIAVTLGRDRLISGFELGVQGMREGGKRRILIPAELGYLDEKAGPLPAAFGDRRRLFATVLNSRRFKKAGDLVIDVQLRKVRPPP